MAGGARFCMSSMDECNTESHTRSRGLIGDNPGGKGGVKVVIASSATRLPSSAFYQSVLSGAAASNIKNFEGLPLSSYTLESWRKIFQVLEAVAQHTPILSPEGIKIAKGEGIKNERRIVT